MNHLHSQQMWELMHARQEEMRREAQREHLAKMVRQPQARGWKNPFRRQAQNLTLALNASATPELG